MSIHSVAFLFVQYVAPSLVYHVLFKFETECRVINFLLCFSGALFALSLEHFGSWSWTIFVVPSQCEGRLFLPFYWWDSEAWRGM